MSFRHYRRQIEILKRSIVAGYATAFLPSGERLDIPAGQMLPLLVYAMNLEYDRIEPGSFAPEQRRPRFDDYLSVISSAKEFRTPSEDGMGQLILSLLRTGWSQPSGTAEP